MAKGGFRGGMPMGGMPPRGGKMPKMPKDFDPSKMPKDFDPSKLPKDFDPSKMPPKKK